MTNFRDLKLKNEPEVFPKVENWDGLPEQRGGFTPPLPPGDYEFQLPSREALANAWDVFETTIKEKKVERVSVQFSPETPLTVTRGPNGSDGLIYAGRISNAERNRARR